MSLGSKKTAPAAAPTAASTPAKSKYDALSTTQVTQRGNYLTPGHYLLRINSFRKGSGFRAGPMFIAEMTVVHAFADSPAGANTAGTDVADVMKESNVAFMARLRGFLDAAGNLTQDDWNTEGGDAIVRQASGEDQPLAGNVVEVRVSTVVKQTAINKQQKDLVPADTYARHDYLRAVPASEIKSVLGENATKFFPNIDELIAAENA